MSDLDSKKLGPLIQAYARARWSKTPDEQAADGLEAQLGRELRDRIDVLGIDVERLLSVDAGDVVAELQALEKEAAAEDAGARSTAARVRAREEGRSHDDGKGDGRDRRARPGQNRQSARHGRGRQRG